MGGESGGRRGGGGGLWEVFTAVGYDDTLEMKVPKEGDCTASDGSSFRSRSPSTGTISVSNDQVTSPHLSAYERLTDT